MESTQHARPACTGHCRQVAGQPFQVAVCKPGEQRRFDLRRAGCRGCRYRRRAVRGRCAARRRISSRLQAPPPQTSNSRGAKAGADLIACAMVTAVYSLSVACTSATDAGVLCSSGASHALPEQLAPGALGRRHGQIGFGQQCAAAARPAPGPARRARHPRRKACRDVPRPTDPSGSCRVRVSKPLTVPSALSTVMLAMPPMLTTARSSPACRMPRRGKPVTSGAASPPGGHVAAAEIGHHVDAGRSRRCAPDRRSGWCREGRRAAGAARSGRDCRWRGHRAAQRPRCSSRCRAAAAEYLADAGVQRAEFIEVATRRVGDRGFQARREFRRIVDDAVRRALVNRPCEISSSTASTPSMLVPEIRPA